MRYMLMIYEGEDAYGGPEKNGPRLQEVAARHRALAQELGATWIGGGGLGGTAHASTIRTKGGTQVVHDGPFAESKEQIGGYHVIEAESLEAAIAIARRIPLAADGAIEVRPIFSMPMGAA
jgi:hypothetical protein